MSALVSNGPITRVIAVDWSGSADIKAQRRGIWLCEWNGAGVVRLEGGRTRDELVRALVDAIDADAALAIGLDFAFGFPGWFVEQEAGGSPHRLWTVATELGESWLARCEPPFWGRPGKARPVDDEARPAFRQTERETRAVRGIRPKSVFQIGGAGSVGTGSIRGMSALHALSNAGATIWPFDAASLPVVVEIYPRLLTGDVKKANAEARAAYLAMREWTLPPDVRTAARESEDAFDALVSAESMWRHRRQLASLPLGNPIEAIEGIIWAPTAAHASSTLTHAA